MRSVSGKGRVGDSAFRLGLFAWDEVENLWPSPTGAHCSGRVTQSKQSPEYPERFTCSCRSSMSPAFSMDCASAQRFGDTQSARSRSCRESCRRLRGSRRGVPRTHSAALRPPSSWMLIGELANMRYLVSSANRACAARFWETSDLGSSKSDRPIRVEGREPNPAQAIGWRSSSSSSPASSRAGASAPCSNLSARSRLWWCSATICSSMVPFATRR